MLRQATGVICGALAVSCTFVAVVTALWPAAASASSVAALRQRAPGSEMTLSQAPAGLQAAVRRTLRAPTTPAASIFQKAMLTASDGFGGNYFGQTVAISGSTAVVGASYNPNNFGAVYIFVRSNGVWSQQAELLGSDEGSDDKFGASVAINGSTVVVGAPTHTFSNGITSGAAYVFTRSGTTWSQQAELHGYDGVTGDWFGRSVAINGSTVVVGAPGPLNNTSRPGRAYVYVGPNWSTYTELTASDPANGDYFGGSVGVYGSSVLIGAPAKNSARGAAYVFVSSGGVWSQQAKLTASDAATADHFGGSVAVYGSTAVIGAPYKNSSVGAGYVFVQSGSVWSQQAELTASGGSNFGASAAISGSTLVLGSPYTAGGGAAYVFARSGTAWFQETTLTVSGTPDLGYSVAIDGSTVIAGAPDASSGTSVGAAYVFALPSRQAKLTEATAATGDEFGYAVALAGSTAVVGAPGRSSGTGAAYVFVRSGSGWSQQAELTAADGAVGDQFGGSVSIYGPTVVVGAPGKSSSAGAAYVFANNSGAWSQQAELTASDGSTGDGFGNAVAINGSSAVVGAWHQNGDTGAAYVFVSSGGVWSQQAKLTASPGSTGDQLGVSVAINGSTAMVGAGGSSSGKGAVLVFVRSGSSWSQKAALTAADGLSGDSFGSSVALYGATAVIGAPGRTSNTGAAYLFIRSSMPYAWSQQAELTASDGSSGDDFGGSVGLYGSTAMVGAPGKNSSGGAAYLFIGSSGAWPQEAEIFAPDATPQDQFGYSLALSGTTAVVGAPFKKSSTGAAYAFTNV